MTSPESPPPKKAVLPFIAVMAIMFFGMISIVKSLDIVAVKNEWADRRCELFVMAAAPLFKPTDDDRTATQFAADNFDFCMRNLQSQTLKSAMSPIYEMMQGQVGASDTVASTLNNLRTIMSNTVNNTIGVVIGSFYEQFKKYAAAASLTAQRLRMAMNRISVSTTAMLYMAISTIRGILNAIDFILLVAIIVVTILAVLFIILFFVLFPSVPLILSVIALLVAAGVQVGGLRNTFCFAPETRIMCETGLTRPISSIKVGDVLCGGGIVTGMYVFDGSCSQMYDLYGIHVAGDHMVFNCAGSEWCYVSDHPDASPISARYERVYCPVVDNRRVPVSGEGEHMAMFRDWEEVETDAEELAWEKWVWSVLNPGVAEPADIGAHTDHIGYAADTCVYIGGVPTMIAGIGIGDHIDDKDGLATKIIGVYHGIAMAGGKSGNWELDADGVWRRTGEVMPKTVPTYHLVTESGTFKVGGRGRIVCDATEVGSDVIHHSYPTVLASIRAHE
jgi:hypothetical protein